MTWAIWPLASKSEMSTNVLWTKKTLIKLCSDKVAASLLQFGFLKNYRELLNLGSPLKLAADGASWRLKMTLDRTWDDVKRSHQHLEPPLVPPDLHLARVVQVVDLGLGDRRVLRRLAWNRLKGTMRQNCAPHRAYLGLLSPPFSTAKVNFYLGVLTLNKFGLAATQVFPNNLTPKKINIQKMSWN